MAFLLVTGGLFCTKPFELEGGEADKTILVVEGNIIAGDGASNSFRLTRMGSVGTADTSRVTGAQVDIVSSDGSRWAMRESEPGIYSEFTSIPADKSLSLRIRTSVGDTYETPFQKSIVSPAIDSVTWEEENQDRVRIFVHASDPTNTLKFYKWTFEETWESRSRFEAFLGFDGSSLFTLGPGEMYYQCWKTLVQEPILVANTNNLAQNVVSRKEITSFSKPDERMYTRYSILVKQTGITPEAYNFWEILRKNTELTGSLFDPQPSRMPTNIRCTNDPDKLAIGFITASTETTKRLFIRNSELTLWPRTDPDQSCPEVIYSTRSQAEDFLRNNPSFLPAVIQTTGGLSVAPRICVDCRLLGGTTQKPIFW
jgi:hypothetical protein